MTSPNSDIERKPAATSIPFTASDYYNDGKRHLLLGASGSVATIKIPNILNALASHHNLAIRLVLTQSAKNFLAGQSPEQPSLDALLQYPNVEGIYQDEDEWAPPWKRGQGILHIELRRWADILVICPLNANTLAKIVGGFSDNLLTSVVRAWDTTGEVEAGSRAVIAGEARLRGKKRILVAPAMNTAMWIHPISKKQIAVLEEEWGIDESKSGEEGWFEVLRPQEKELACGDVGMGALKDWREIVAVIEERLGLLQ